MTAPHILLVEDEPAIRDALAYTLGSEGFRTTTAGTLHEAQALLAETSPDLIVLDVGLPDGSGFDALRQWRKTAEIPVLFLTARAGEIDRVVGLELGADDYVTKPFSPREVAARIRAILRRTVKPAATKPGATGLVIDSDRHLATLDGRPLDLSRQELRILQILHDQPGVVFSRSRLLDLAWDDPGNAFERTVDSHIKALRNALRTIRPDSEPIRTVRGEGYALADDFR